MTECTKNDCEELLVFQFSVEAEFAVAFTFNQTFFNSPRDEAVVECVSYVSKLVGLLSVFSSLFFAKKTGQKNYYVLTLPGLIFFQVSAVTLDNAKLVQVLASSFVVSCVSSTREHGNYHGASNKQG